MAADDEVEAQRAGLRKIHQEVAALHDQAAVLHERYADDLDAAGRSAEATEQRHAARLDKLKAKHEWDTAKRQ